MSDHVLDDFPVGAVLASALMAANYPGDSGEDVDRLIDELYKRGYSLQPMRNGPDPAPPWMDLLQSAYSMALIQIEADGRTIERLKRALTVAHHRPHDNLGPPDPDSGFPTCSGCEAILTEPDAGLASEDRP